MKILLDTHVFLWAAGAPERLSDSARECIEADANELWLSVASLWEIQLKAEKGLLLTRFDDSRHRMEFVRDQIEAVGVGILPVRSAHVFALAGIPVLHKDPFDRMLIAQATAGGYTLLTGDNIIRQYPVATLW